MEAVKDFSHCKVTYLHFFVFLLSCFIGEGEENFFLGGESDFHLAPLSEHRMIYDTYIFKNVRTSYSCLALRLADSVIY